MKTFYCLIALLFGFSANAADVYLFSAKAQETADQVAHIGIRTNAKNQITAVLYLKDGDRTPEDYSVSEASRCSVVMVRKLMVFKVVSFKLSEVTPTSMVINFKYLHDHTGTNFIYHTKSVAVSFNASLGKYEARDIASNRAIRQIYVISHFVQGDLKGIDEIQTL